MHLQGINGMNGIYWTCNTCIWDNPSHWLIFFKMVKTPNQVCVDSHLQIIQQLRGRFMLLAEEIQCDFMSNSDRRPSSRFSLLLTQPAKFQGWIALTSETWMGESTESKFGPIIRGTFGPLKLDETTAVLILNILNIRWTCDSNPIISAGQRASSFEASPTNCATDRIGSIMHDFCGRNAYVCGHILTYTYITWLYYLFVAV